MERVDKPKVFISYAWSSEEYKQFNVTRERIRQIEAKALRKLRQQSRSKNLRMFLD